MPGRERPLLNTTTSKAGAGAPGKTGPSQTQQRSSPRSKKQKGGNRHNALSEDLHADKYVVPGQNAKKKRGLDRHADDIDEQSNVIDNEMEAGMMDQKMAKRILLQSRQRREANRLRKDSGAAAASAVGGDDSDDDDDDQDDEGDDGDAAVDQDGAVGGAGGGGDDDDNENDDDYDDDDDNNNNADYYVGGEDDEEAVEIEYSDTESQAPSEMVEFPDLGQDLELDEEEARLLGKFQPQAPTQSRNLADIILEKIREKEESQKAALEKAEFGSQAGGDKEHDPNHIDSRVRRVYHAIGRILKGYTAGKIPKAFKILPRVQNWEQLILVTKPEDWSPHATYQATRIFAAALNERMAQRFYNAILLPIVHNHILQNKHLHPALYMSLRKALFKPIAFYKGFLLPLCDGGECALREAMIIGSVLQKMHLQPIPTAVVIVKICEMPFSSSNVLLLRVLIDKKMSLPFQAIDSLVAFFHRFGKAHKHDEKLPVLWHQALLSFVQRYRTELKKEQIALLHEVCNKHFHSLITPEIRRELAAAVGAVSSYH